MPSNLLKSVVIIAGVALGVAAVGALARRIVMRRFDAGADLDAGADEFGDDGELDYKVEFINEDEADADAEDDADDAEDDEDDAEDDEDSDTES